MANKVAQEVNGQAPGSTYSGPAALLPFYLAKGYVYDDTSSTDKLKNTDTTPANDPMLASNREDPGDAFQFGTDAALAPRVEGVLPKKVALAGAAVTVSGDNFTGATGVTFGGTAGTAFSVADDNTIKVTAPAKTAGTYDVVVLKGVGNGTLTGGIQYA